MWEFENDRWIDNCIWNSIDNNWLKIVAAELQKYQNLCHNYNNSHDFCKDWNHWVQDVNFATWLLLHDQHIIIHMIFTKIEVTEFKMPIFAA